MHKILLHVGTSTFFNSQFLLAKQLKLKGIDVIFFFDNYYPFIDVDLQILTKENIKYILYEDLLNPGFNVSSYILINFTKRVLYKFIGLLKRIWIFEILFELCRQIYKYRALIILLKKNKITGINLISDLVQYDTALLIKSGNKLNINTVITPLFFANHKEAAEFFGSDSRYQISKNQISLFLKSKILRKWVIYYKGVYLKRLSLSKIITKELLKISPEHPWIVNSGKAKVLAVESEILKKKFSIELKQNIEVVGSVNLDIIYNSRINLNQNLNCLYNKYDFDFNKKIALIAIPPDVFTSRKGITHFSDYSELLKFWIDSIKYLTNYNILISLHPSTKFSEHSAIDFLEYKILDQPLIEVIGLVDLFIASISATIQWAIVCGIPVINYDVYRFNYDDYLGIDGILYCDKPDLYLEKLRLINDPDYYQIIKNNQMIHSKMWGILDGDGANRIIKLLNK